MHDQTSSDWRSVAFCVFYLSSKTRKHVSNSGVRKRSTHMQRSECMRLCNVVLTAIARNGRLTVGDRYRPFSSLAIVTMCMGQGPNSASRERSGPAQWNAVQGFCIVECCAGVLHWVQTPIGTRDLKFLDSLVRFLI